jgi:site-specific DNA-methyltransferase (adenine-specific)
MSVREAAAKLGISERRVRQLIGTGKLKSQKIGRSWVIGISDLNMVRDRKPGRPSKGATNEHPWRTRQDWGTPPNLFIELDKEFCFTIDGAADAGNALVPRFFSLEQNALTQSWQGERVFLNPPYVRTLKFVQKAVSECQGKCLVVMILPVRAGNRAWQQYILPKATEIRYLPGRLTFVGASHYAPFDVAVVVFGSVSPTSPNA